MPAVAATPADVGRTTTSRTYWSARVTLREPPLSATGYSRCATGATWVAGSRTLTATTTAPVCAQMAASASGMVP